VHLLSHAPAVAALLEARIEVRFAGRAPARHAVAAVKTANVASEFSSQHPPETMYFLNH